MNAFKPYRKEHDCTYTIGAFATLELLRTCPRHARMVYIHPGFKDIHALASLCESLSIRTQINEKIFSRLSQKENCFVCGVFEKYSRNISPAAAHVVLVNPADMGNLGTIIRLLAGIGGYELAIINPSADVWHPKTVRASMGAHFHLPFEHFESFEHYTQSFQNRCILLFMTDGQIELAPCCTGSASPFSLVFGNEAHGLDERLRPLGTSVRIPQSGTVDSLNLACAVAIGAFVMKA